jgi:soluble lytic murein transglycosylase-like protein
MCSLRILVQVLNLTLILFPMSIIPSYGQTRSQFPKTRMTDDLARKIVSISRSYGLPPLLILEIMRQESGFNPRATSSANAGGLMQMISPTAARFGITDRYDVVQSIHGGCRYIVWLSNRYGRNNLDLILAAYNSGEGNVDRALRVGHRIPKISETQNYVRSILYAYRRALEVEKTCRSPEPQLYNYKRSSRKELKTRLSRMSIPQMGGR